MNGAENCTPPPMPIPPRVKEVEPDLVLEILFSNPSTPRYGVTIGTGSLYSSPAPTIHATTYSPGSVGTPKTTGGGVPETYGELALSLMRLYVTDTATSRGKALCRRALMPA